MPATSSATTRRTSSAVTGSPVSSSTPAWTHCHTCDRLISAVAASSISPWMPTAPLPPSQAARYPIAPSAVARRRGLGPLPRHAGDVEQLGRGDDDVVATAVELVGPVAEDGVEGLAAGADQIGV